jgi:hypothetical protein
MPAVRPAGIAVPTTVTLSQISFGSFKHSKGKSPFHHAAHGCRQKRFLQPDSLPKLFADLPADAKPTV